MITRLLNRQGCIRYLVFIINKTLIVVFTIILIGCATAKSEYKKARKANTVSLFESYLIRYPKSPYKQEVLNEIERLDYDYAKKNNTIKEWARFLKRHPSSKYTVSVYETIDSLNWVSTTRIGTIASYKKFLIDYPNSNYVYDADQRIQETLLNEWKNADERATQSNLSYWLNDYIRNYPDSPYVHEAYSRIDSIRTVKKQHIEWLWARSYKASGDFSCAGITTDEEGSIYCTGSFTQTIIIGDKILESKGNCDIYVVKLDSSGNCVWALSAGGSNSDNSLGIVSDKKGYILITGSISSKNVSIGESTITAVGQSELFVSKIDKKGEWVWTKTSNCTSSTSVYDMLSYGPNAAIGYGIAVDSQCNVYVVGSVIGEVNIGNTKLNRLKNKTAAIPVSPDIDSWTYMFDYDSVLAKLTANGDWLWAERFGKGSLYDCGKDVDVDSNDSIFFVGTTVLVDLPDKMNFGGYVAAKFDKSDNWNYTLDSTGDGTAQSIVLDSEDNVYVTGTFQKEISVRYRSYLNSVGKSDMFIYKFDSQGKTLWGRRLGNSSDNKNGIEIAVDDNGSAYLISSFTGSLYFGDQNISCSDGEKALFIISKLDGDGNLLWTDRSILSNELSDIFEIALSDKHIYLAGKCKGLFINDDVSLTEDTNEQYIFLAKLKLPGK